MISINSKRFIMVLNKYRTSFRKLIEDGIINENLQTIHYFIEMKFLPKRLFDTITYYVKFTDGDIKYVSKSTPLLSRSKRIKYKTTDGVTFVNKNPVMRLDTGSVYQVIYNLSDMSYKIKNVRGRRIVAEEKNIKNKNRLLDRIKKALDSLGIAFSIEVRIKRK